MTLPAKGKDKSAPEGWRVQAPEYGTEVMVKDAAGNRWLWKVQKGTLVAAYRFMLLAMEKGVALRRVRPGSINRMTYKWGPIRAPQPAKRFWILEAPGLPPLVLKCLRGDPRVRHLVEHLNRRLKEIDQWQSRSAA
jgi:hypothetical protein